MKMVGRATRSMRNWLRPPGAFLACLLALHVPAGAQDNVAAIELEVLSAGDIDDLSCETFDLDQLGFTAAESIDPSHLEKKNPARYIFTLQIFRFRATDVELDKRIVVEFGGAAAVDYWDLALAYHLRTPEVKATAERFLADLGIDDDKAYRKIECPEGIVDNKLVFRHPFHSLTNGGRKLSPTVVPIIFAYLGEIGAGPDDGPDGRPAPVDNGVVRAPLDKVAPPDKLDRADRGHLATVEPDAAKSTGPDDAKPAEPKPYPWAAEYHLENFVDREEVFVLDRVQCAKAGNFVVGSVAQVAEGEAKRQGDEVTVQRRLMYAANQFYGVGGDPADRSLVEASIDPSHFWCVPKREVCYKQIEFGQFGVAAEQDEKLRVNRNKIYNLRFGLMAAILKIAGDICLDQSSVVSKGVQ